MTSLKTEYLMGLVEDHNRSYMKRKIEEIEEDIKSSAKEGEFSVWITFVWSEGNYSEIIKHFESNGFKVKCPTSPWEGDSTSYLFDWSHP